LFYPKGNPIIIDKNVLKLSRIFVARKFLKNIEMLKRNFS